MDSGHRRILAKPVAEQTQSPLYSKLPGEIRGQVFAFALTDYPDPDPARRYSPDTCFTRPSYFAPRKSDVQLLRTCRAIYRECWHLPFILKEQLYWLTTSDRAPPEFRRSGPRLSRWLQQIAELQGEDKVVIDKLRVFAQMFKLEEGAMGALLRTPHLQPRSITLTIRHADWWWWESDAPLSFQNAWLKDACAALPSTVDEIHIELESLQRKAAQVDEIAKQMAQRWFFKRRDGGALFADNRPGAAQTSRWTGTSSWHNQRWVRDETREGQLDFYIVTISFRLTTVLERRGSLISNEARANASRNRYGGSLDLHIPDAEAMQWSQPSVFVGTGWEGHEFSSDSYVSDLTDEEESEQD